MNYLIIAGNQDNISEHDDIVAFLASFTSPSGNKQKNFCIRTEKGKKSRNYKLYISDISRKDESGKSFMFKARGFAFSGSWIPIGSQVEGCITF